MKQLWWYKTYILTDTKLITSTVENIIGYLNDYISFSEHILFEVRVILNELMTNAIIHGNRRDNTKKVYIEVGVCNDNQLCIIIEDEGEGGAGKVSSCCMGDKKQISNADVFNLNERGRGLKIVSSLSDTMKINQKGNKVVVLKTISNE